jgi:hypothetical protein
VMLSQVRQENFSRTCWITFLPRHELQHLGHVLADLVQRPAATWTGRGSRIDDPFARQVLRQRPARRLAPLGKPRTSILAAAAAICAAVSACAALTGFRPWADRLQS